MPIPSEYREICEMLVTATKDGRIAWIEKDGFFIVRLPDYSLEMWSGTDENETAFVAIGLRDPKERRFFDNWFVADGDADFDMMQALASTVRRQTGQIPQKLDSLRRQLMNGGKIGLDEDDLLNSPLSLSNLAEYTNTKFRGLKASLKLQTKLLHDIEMSNYPTLRHIDNAVNRAMPALEAYKQESPNMFVSGTDYITKALGFVDTNFRAVHGFSSETITAFAKYGSLVRVA